MNKQYTFAASVLSDLALTGSEEVRLEAASTLLMTAHIAGTEAPDEKEAITKEREWSYQVLRSVREQAAQLVEATDIIRVGVYSPGDAAFEQDRLAREIRKIQPTAILKEAVESHDNLFDQIGHVLSEEIRRSNEGGQADWNNSNEIDYLVNAIRPLISQERGIIELELPQGDERELVIMMDTLTEGKRLLSVKIEDNVEQKQNKADADALKKVTEAIHKYYEALDTRQHGAIAMHAAFSEIETTLGMFWGMHKKG